MVTRKIEPCITFVVGSWADFVFLHKINRLKNIVSLFVSWAVDTQYMHAVNRN